MSKYKQLNTKYRYFYIRIFAQIILLILAMILFAGCSKRTDLIKPLESPGAGSATSLSETGELPGGAGCVTEGGLISAEGADTDHPVSSQIGATVSDAAEVVIYVHICGAVQSEGLYELQVDARVSDAIDAAGGFLPEADTTYLNLAAKLTDGMQIMVPAMKQKDQISAGSDLTQAAGYGQESIRGGISTAVIPTAESEQNTPQQGAGLVNINTASTEELCSLTGIGTAKAADIIAYRETNGLFRRTEDLMQVSGIGEKMYAKVKDKITVQ